MHKGYRHWEKINLRRAEILKQRCGKPIEIDAVELIDQMREERDNKLLGVIKDLEKHRSGR